MPLNGLGTFEPNSPEYPAVPDTLILASDWNTILEDIAGALSTALYRDGQAAATANISMGNHKLINVQNGSNPQDATTVLQVFTNPTFTGTVGTGVVLAGNAVTVTATLLDVNSTTVDVDSTTVTVSASETASFDAVTSLTLDSAQLIFTGEVTATSTTDLSFTAVDNINLTATDIVVTGSLLATLNTATTAVNQLITDDSTKIATTHFVQQAAFQSAVPILTGKTNHLLGNDGVDVNWVNLIDADVISFADGTDSTKRASLSLAGITAGQDRVITIPDSNLTVVGTATQQTLTNKTIEIADTNLQLFATGAATKEAHFDLSLVTAGQDRVMQVADENMLLFTPGLRLLQTFTAPGGTDSFDIEPTVIDNTYDVYILEVTDVTFSASPETLRYRLKVAGSYVATGYNQLAVAVATISGGAAGVITDAGTNTSTASLMFEFKLQNPEDTSKYQAFHFKGSCIGSGAASSVDVNGAGYVAHTGAVTGIRFLSNSGNIDSMTARWYGLRK